MLVREVFTDAKTGETGERWIEMPGVIAAEQASAGEQWADELEASEAEQQAIRDEIAAIEQQGLAAMMDGDDALLARLKAARRALLK